MRSLGGKGQVSPLAFLRGQRGLVAQYHTYPEPGDKGVFSSSVSKKQKFGNEANKAEVDKKFKTNVPFPGIQSSQNQVSTEESNVQKTVLANGLTVASQDMRGLLTSIIVLVKTGR
jgi:hypothetical protein